MQRKFFTDLAELAGQLAAGTIRDDEAIMAFAHVLKGTPGFKADKFLRHADTEARYLTEHPAYVKGSPDPREGSRWNTWDGQP